MSDNDDTTAIRRTNGEQNGRRRRTSDFLKGKTPLWAGDTSSMIEELIDADKLSEGSKEILRNLRSRDLPLSYFTEPEITEIRWKLRIKRELFFAMHPGDDCLVTGEDRAAINDDPTDRLTPLDRDEEIVARDYFDMIETRALRAREMKQQEMLRTRIQEHRDDEEEQRGGLLGRLRGD